MAANNTYFFRNDAIFPEDLAYIIKKKCSENGIYFLNKGDYIIIGIRFKDDYEYHDEKIIYAVKIKNDKKLNYWSDMIYDGKHHYSGPGYPSNAIHEQSPISKEDFINIIDTEIEHMKRKKEMFSENTIKKTYKLTESRLSELIAESVKKVLKEGDSFNFYKDKEDKSGELTKKILFLRSNAVQLYEFIEKGNGIWGYRVGDSEEMQQERLELANDVVRAINRLYKSVNEADFNDAEKWNKFGV